MQKEAVDGDVGTQEKNSVSKAAPNGEVQEVLDDYDPDTLCGIGSFRPKWLQRMATPKVFLFNYCILGVFQGAQFTYLVGCLSTLEKRYAYDSKMTGVIMIADELPPVLFGLLVGYYGGKAHRPRLINAAMLVGVASCLLMALPYFVFGPAEHLTGISLLNQNGTKAEMCDSEEKSKLCEKFPSVAAVILLFFGNFLKGFCSLTFYTVGPTYMDDSVEKKNSPLYFGTAFALRLLGPVIGFLLSSLCLQFYENPFVDPGFDQNDPRWVGAWWLGFVIIGLCILVTSMPISLFPRHFKKENGEESAVRKEEKRLQSLSPKEQVKEMKNVLVRLLKNPVYMFHVIGSVFYLNGVAGYYVYMPRYMEAQFRQSASKASLLSGPISVVSMQFGTFLGGVVLRKFRPRPRILTGYIVFVDIIAVIGLLACMTFTCPLLQMTGTTLLNDQRTLQLENACNMGCQCTTKTYTPVCGPDGKSTYFSPCYAGCTGVNKTGVKEMFTGCKCVHDQLGGLIEDDVEKNYCRADCGYMTPYIAVLSAGKLVASTSRVGSMMVYLRSVSVQDKSVALGVLEGSLSLLAFIPYPLIYGALMDMTCFVWERSCGRRGNCWVYDVDKFRYFLHGVTSAFIGLAALMNVFMCVYSNRIKNLYDDEEEEEKGSDGEKVEKKRPDQTEMVTLKHIEKPKDENSVENKQ